jgi:Xaa-Pro aminopeptidase
MKPIPEVSELPINERDRRWTKVREEMWKRELGALVVWGSSAFFSNYNVNLRYLCNEKTEGYLVFPLEAEPTLLTFIRKKPEVAWVTDWRSGHPKYSRAISDRLKELHIEDAKIGIVGLSGYFGEMGFPHTTYVSLTDYLPAAHLEDATEIVEDAQRIKSDVEISCIKVACKTASKVLQTVVDTAKVGVKDYEVRSKIMDTLLRNGSDFDTMVFCNSGKEIFHAAQAGSFQPADGKTLQKGDVILTEFDCKYLGYNAQHNQPFSVGKPDREWSDIFSVAVEAFDQGLKTLKPGITMKELDEAFLSPMRKSGYTHHNPCFHGLGLGIDEPLGSLPAQYTQKPKTSFVMQAGMVLEFEPHVVTSNGKKGLTLGCPVLVTESGCELLNESWQPEFKVA